jgi:AmmeMemoRadiSam system radical SAM enzyme
VRARRDDAIVLTSYGRSSGFCVDPIEKKPLNHFLPGTSVLSFGTAGCNLACRFCQNWDISKSRELDTLADAAAPEAIARAAQRLGCASVAFTYTDPVIFAEYAMDVADACHALGIKAVAVTAGYMNPAPRADFYRHMDVANVDLKGFREAFYADLCAAHLGPVLDTLRYLVHETGVWIEITTLLIPGRLRRGARPPHALGRGGARAAGAPALHRLPSRLQAAGRAAHAAGDPDPRTRDRPGQRGALRLYGQRARPERAVNGLPCLRRAPHRA